MAKFKIFGNEIAIGKDLNQYNGRSDDLLSVTQSKYGYDYRTRNKLRAYRNVVYGCVSLIGEACGGYQPILQQKRGDQWESIDHEFLQLLRQPSGKDLKATSFSGFDLWEATSSYQALQGDCFWYLATGKTTGKPKEIVVLRADRVGTDIDPKTGDINGYFIRQAGGGTPLPLEINEVLRFPTFNPSDPYKGYGAVEAGADYIETDESTAEFTKNFFNNNAGLSGVLNIKGEVSKGAFRKFVRAWRDKYQGVSNAGKIAILRDSDAEFTKVGLGLDELDMDSLRKMSLQDVAMIFKVPLELLGRITEGSGLGRGNVETLEYIFAKWNIDKKMLRYDNIIMFALQRYYGLDTATYRVVHKNIIPDDKEFDLLSRDKAVDRWLARNEIRDIDGLDPVDGGDQLLATIQQIPISDVSMDAGTTASTAGKSTGPITVKITRKMTPAELAAAKKKDSPLAKTADQAAERYRLSLERLALRYAKRYAQKARPILEAQRKEVLATLPAHASKDFQLFDDSDYDQQMTAAFTPVLADLAEVQGGLAMVFAGDTENEFLLSAPLKSILEKGTLMMAQNFNDRTIEKLNVSLADGVAQGESLSKLTKRVNEIYDQAKGYEATRIARTETLKASNSATLWGYSQTGYVTQKQWVVNPDACAECGDYDGKTVPLDDAFLGLGDSHTYTDENGDEQTTVNTYDTIDVPPLHPNCRCTIIPVS
jgi:HK97 family phage portal protein